MNHERAPLRLDTLVRCIDAWAGVALADLWATMCVFWLHVRDETVPNLLWTAGSTIVVWVGIGLLVLSVDMLVAKRRYGYPEGLLASRAARGALPLAALYPFVFENKGAVLPGMSRGGGIYVFLVLALFVWFSFGITVWRSSRRQTPPVSVILMWLLLSGYAFLKTDVSQPLLFSIGSVLVAALLAWITRSGQRAVYTVGVLMAVIAIPLAVLAVPKLPLPSPKNVEHSNNDQSVLLITIDTLRKDAVGFYSDNLSMSKTPTIDSLAVHGVSFDCAVSPSPWTVPALASILTGEYPSVHTPKQKGTRISPSVRMVAEAAQNAGILTAAIVSNPYLSRGSGFDRGFDYYYHLPAPAPFATTAHRIASVKRADRVLLINDDASGVRTVTELFLQKLKGGPFFLWVHFIDPHIPYTPHSDSLSSQLSRYKWRFLAQNIWFDLRTGKRMLSPEQKQLLKSLYMDEVQFTDRMIGHILHRLRAKDLASETTVIVCSDHGEEFWDHGGLEHGHTLYDELIMAPLIISPSGFAGRLSVSALGTTASIAPTISEVLGVRRELGTAPSLVGYWKHAQPRVTPLHHVISEAMLYFGPGRAIRTKRFKFIDWRGKQKRLLFDLEADPEESFSVSNDNKPIVEQAESSLAAYGPLPEETIPMEEGEVLNTFERERLRLLGYVE